ncbi:MAG: helix-turn-helix transcriptional regulator [Clostridia bacterium]|nr:helix-turn-helix transcriptional regulator [Clostridia bacterium]
MDIGTKIKNAREDKDIFQKDMAELIPMNQSNYSKIERNTQEPNMHQLKRIAEILNLDLNELLEIKQADNKKVISETDLHFADEIKKLYKMYYPTEN